jgi:hypothetical protein
MGANNSKETPAAPSSTAPAASTGQTKTAAAPSSSSSSSPPPPPPSSVTTTITILEARESATGPSASPALEYLLQWPAPKSNSWASAAVATQAAIDIFEASGDAKWTCSHCDKVYQYNQATCAGCKKSRDVAAVKWEVTLDKGKKAFFPVILTALTTTKSSTTPLT